jgi:light-regulated signal transduction histidine kinase (bacteriophytochrome)
VLSDALADLDASIRDSGAIVTFEPLPTLAMHAAHLRQLFQNLISNAIKYRAPDRQAQVRIGVKRDDDRWIFIVEDNGIGIPKEYKEHIFGLFKRLHSESKYAGTGVGLAICQRIVERYGGRIWVESQPGKGSTFFFTVTA